MQIMSNDGQHHTSESGFTGSTYNVNFHLFIDKHSGLKRLVIVPPMLMLSVIDDFVDFFRSRLVIKLNFNWMPTRVIDACFRVIIF